MIGGQFRKYGPSTSVVGLVRVNSTTGAKDATFNYGNIGSAFTNRIIDIITYDGGYVICGFGLDNLDLTTRGLFKLTSTGVIDPSFNLPSSTDSATYNTVVETDDGKLLVGGNMSSYSGFTTKGLVLLNSDGTVSTTFNLNSGGIVNKIIKITDGFIITGYFTSFNGTAVTNICKIDNDYNLWPFTDIIITTLDLPQTIQNTYDNLVEFNTTTGLTYSISGNSVVMEYEFDEEEIVLASVYDTPDHVEITYVNESEPITAYVTDIVVRSPHFIFSTESNFDYTTFNVKAWEGNIFSGASEPILYTITKQKLLSIQNNIFVNINNYVKEKLEANVISFFDTEYLIAQDLPEGLSKWVEVETTTYYSGSSVSTNIERLFCTDGYIYPTEVQNIPNVLVTGTKRYISRNQLQRIYFKTYDLISIEAIYYNMFNSPTSFDITFAEQVYLNNQYVQTIALPPLTNINRIEYTFSYGSEVSVITYYVYDECLYDNYTIIYKNKWGVLESIPMTKKHSKQLTVSSNDLNRSIVDYNGNYDINRHTKKQFNTQGNETYILNTEYLPEYMNQAIEELMLSEEIWLYKDNIIIPCLRKEDSINYKTKLNDKLIQYTMSVELSHNTIKNIL